MFDDWVIKAYVTVVERFRSTIDGGEKGQGMIEYGLLVALISVVVIAVLIALGGGVSNNFHKVVNAQ